MAAASPTALEHLQQANASDDDADGDNDDDANLPPDLDVPIPVGKAPNARLHVLPSFELTNACRRQDISRL